MSVFENFINKVIYKGDTDEARRRWKPQYKDQRDTRGDTVLHYACMDISGDREGLVRLLVSLGCDIEAQTDDFGLRPLHRCVMNDNLEAMRALIEAGCSLSPIDKYGDTPLMMADKYGYQECAALLRSSIEATKKTSPDQILSSNDQKVIDVAKTKQVDMKELQRNKLLELLKNNSLSKIMEPETGKTLLDQILNSKDQKVIDAAKTKKVDVQEINDWKKLSMNASQVGPRSLQLLQECLLYRCIDQKYPNGAYILCTANIVNRGSLFMGPTALETAVRSGLEVWVHEVLNKLVEVDESWSKARDIAKRGDLRDILEMIAKRRRYLERKKKKGISRLHVAVVENDPDMVEHLLNRGVIDADECHENIGSALGLAYHVDHIDCAKTLQDNKFNVNTLDKFLQTPLHVAISNKIEDLCEYLVDNTTDLEAEDASRMTVLHLSVMKDCRDICERLVRKGARCDKFVNAAPQISNLAIGRRESSSNTLRMPITNRETIFSLCLKIHRTIYPCLLESIDRRSVNLPDEDNNSLLHLSAVSLMPDLCSQLILKSADVDSKNVSGSTPLLQLLKQHSGGNMKEEGMQMIETIKVLVDGGASLNVEDVDGCSVLEKATSYDDEGLLLALIHKGGPITRLKKPLWLSWLQKRHYTMMREVTPLIDVSWLNEWITRDLIIGILNDGDSPLARIMYDHATSQVKADVLETLLHRAATIGDKDSFKAVINDRISSSSNLEGGESLLACLIRDRKVEFVQLVLSSANGPWFADKKNVDNKLPLHVCIESGLWEVLDRLIVETISINQEDVHGNTPLSLLLSKISETEDEILRNRLMTFVKMLIAQAADINLVNKLGRTAISYCTRFDLRLEVEAYHRRLQQTQEVAHANICPICEDEPLNCGLNCGHVFCKTCVQKTVDCYFCRARITNTFKLFL